jgi:hypothetical protein
VAGKGGSKIAEIRQMSGANIQISKSADKEPTAERQIQITGNLHGYLQPGCGSGSESRRAKMTHKSRKKFVHSSNFFFLIWVIKALDPHPDPDWI